MNEIAAAIATRHAQIAQLQTDIDALQRAATVLGGKTNATATRLPKTESKQKRRGMSAAARKAMSKRLKAYWAKRKRARR